MQLENKEIYTCGRIYKDQNKSTWVTNGPYNTDMKQKRYRCKENYRRPRITIWLRFSAEMYNEEEPLIMC